MWASAISFPGLEETILPSEELLLSSYIFVNLFLLAIYAQSSLGFDRELVPGPPQIPKSLDAQDGAVQWAFCIQGSVFTEGLVIFHLQWSDFFRAPLFLKDFIYYYKLSSIMKSRDTCLLNPCTYTA